MSVVETEVRISIGSPRRWWEHNIKVYLEKYGVDWINFSQ
jgi:hypothetical protein